MTILYTLLDYIVESVVGSFRHRICNASYMVSNIFNVFMFVILLYDHFARQSKSFVIRFYVFFFAID